MNIFLYGVLILAIIIEGSLTQLPLVLIALLCLTIVRRDVSVFFVAFVAGILVDIFALRQIGGTSIFLLTFVLLILLYQRKYEIYSYPFVLTASFIGSLLYLLCFGYGNVWGLAGVTIMVGFILFAVVRMLSVEKTSLKYSL